MATQWMIFKHYAFFMNEIVQNVCLCYLLVRCHQQSSRRPRRCAGRRQATRTRTTCRLYRWRSMFTSFINILSLAVERTITPCWLHMACLISACLYKISCRNIFTIFARCVCLPMVFFPFFSVRRTHRLSLFYLVRFSLFHGLCAYRAFRLDGERARGRDEK